VRFWFWIVVLGAFLGTVCGGIVGHILLKAWDKRAYRLWQEGRWERNRLATLEYASKLKNPRMQLPNPGEDAQAPDSKESGLA
jgi:membrane protein YqaA with SNARE-associated domain